MKRTVLLMAVAFLTGCTSREKSYSATPSPPSATASADRQAAAVIQPSELSPEQVRTVQRSLAGRGFAVDASGTFDDRTQTALMDFQRARGLPATGNLNNPTVEALGIDPRDVMPVRGVRPAPARGPGDKTGSGTVLTPAPVEPPPPPHVPPPPPPPPAH